MFENELSEFDSAFSSVENFSGLADGQHDGVVESVILTKTKSSGKPMIVIRFSTNDGRVEYINQVLNIRSAPFIKKNLVALGFPIEGKFSENIETFCRDFKETPIVLLKKTKGEFSNYTLSVLEDKILF